jgi:hypothetical protein
MDDIHTQRVADSKIWLVIGVNSAMHCATMKYLKSRKQIVYQADKIKVDHRLTEILNLHHRIDMLVLCDLQKDVQFQTLFEDIYTISSCMSVDGAGKIIFMLSNDLCYQNLQSTVLYQKLKRAMKTIKIQVHCYESG